MIKKQVVEVPATTRECEEYRECDGCGKRTNSDNWNSGGSRTMETEVSYATGESWPSGGHKTTLEYHMCPECMRTVFEFIKTMRGAEPTSSSYDW